MSPTSDFFVRTPIFVYGNGDTKHWGCAYMVGVLGARVAMMSWGVCGGGVLNVWNVELLLEIFEIIWPTMAANDIHDPIRVVE